MMRLVVFSCCAVNLFAEPASFEVQLEDSQGSYDDVSSIPLAIIEEAVLVHEIPDIPQHHKTMSQDRQTVAMVT